MVLFLVVIPAPAFAKGLTVKITIDGGSRKAAIVISDPQALAPFRVWYGPGTLACANSVSHAPGFMPRSSGAKLPAR